MAECMMRDRLPELWQKIDNAHFSYLETDDCLEKLDQRKKLEGYIMDYLCLVPHERKFRLPETSQVFQKSAAELPDFSGYKAASGWAALAQYAGNLLAQPWRKEYRVIRLYSGFFKHVVDANLSGGEVMLRVMGYRPSSPGCLELDGPVCPDLVAAVSRDSLIAYVECQLMKAVWEELCRRGCSRDWRDVLAQRQRYAGDARGAIAALLPGTLGHRNTYEDGMTYQMPTKMQPPMQTCGRQSLMAQQNTTYQIIDDYNNAGVGGMTTQQMQPCHDHLLPTCLPSSQCQPMQMMHHAPQNIGPAYYQNSINPMPNMLHTINRPETQYGYNGLINPYTGIPNYYFAPVTPNPYMMQYAPIRHVSSIPLNGYKYNTNAPNTQTHSTVVPTGQLIELDPPNEKPFQNGSNKHRTIVIHHDIAKDNRSHQKSDNKSHSSKKHHNMNGDSSEVSRRNNTLKIDTNPSTIPRSDTQPSLSKAKEDGMGTFESWDYVFKNLESQGYSKDLGERGNLLTSQLDRDSKTLDRGAVRESKYAKQTAMDLEDALHALSLDRSSDEDMFRTAKINEMLLKIKLVNEAKLAKINARKLVLADDREKRKVDTSTSPIPERIVELKVSDKARLISKEDAKDKKEIDKLIYMNGHAKSLESRKSEKNTAKCYNIDDKDRERQSVRRKIATDISAIPSTSKMIPSQVPRKKSNTETPSTSRIHSNQISSLAHPNAQIERISPDPNLRLVVTLKEKDTVDASPPLQVKKSPDKRSSKQDTKQRWQCGTCTYLNEKNMAACEMCGKSRLQGPETMPLVSGGKECPACTLVNNRDASVCEACNSSLKYSPTYI